MRRKLSLSDNALPKSSSKDIVGKYIDTCVKSQPTVEVKTENIVEIAQPTSVVPVAVHLNPDTPEFEPKPTVGVTQGNSPCTSADQKLLDLAKSLADQVSISRLPPPEPSVFHGDPLKYPGWKSAFQTLIEQCQIPANEKMHYLKKYLAGPVKDVVEHYFLLPSEDAYDEAKNLLFFFFFFFFFLCSHLYSM